MFCKDSSTVMKNTNSKQIKCVKPNSLVIEILFKITNLPIFIILIINISMMISPWWLQLITVWSHICFLLPVPPPSILVGHQVWLFGGGRWRQFYSKPTTTSKSKASHSALPGNDNTTSKGLQISRGPVLPRYQRGLGVHVSVAAGEHEQHWAMRRSQAHS